MPDAQAQYDKKAKDTLTARSNEFDVWLEAGDHEMRGHVRHRHDQAVYAFYASIHLINIIDGCLDRIGAAQMGFELRRWDGTADADKRGGEGLDRKDDIPSGEPMFLVCVQRRQNATWQGVVKWLDGKKQSQFRSVLELIQLMEQIVAKAPIPSDDLNIEFVDDL